MHDTEHWRLRLLELESAAALPHRKDMAERLEVDPSYYSRLRYPPGKKGGKKLGLETMRTATAAFNLRGDWFYLPLGTDLPGKQPVQWMQDVAQANGTRNRSTGLPASSTWPLQARDANPLPHNTHRLDATLKTSTSPAAWPLATSHQDRLHRLLNTLSSQDKALALRDINGLLDAVLTRWENQNTALSKRAH